jgi:hypothetical protein
MIVAIQSLIPAPPSASARRMTVHAEATKKDADGNMVIKEAFNAIVGKAYPQAIMN